MYENELYHYGVKGMRWGVRRATKNLSKANTAEERQKAVQKLEKHRAKGTKKVAKLEKKHVRLKKDVDRHIQRNDVKIADLRNRAIRKKRKAYKTFSKNKADKLFYEADRLNFKADEIQSYSEKAKAKLYANENLTGLFKEQLNSIDTALADNGRRYING